MQLCSKFWLLALFWISLKRLYRIFFKLHHTIFMMSKTFIKIESLQHLEISRRTGQKSAFQHSLFWRYATDFSKLMPTTHTSMASTFQCEYCQCFTFKICNKIHTKMYCENRFCLHKRENWRTGKNSKTLWERPFPGDTRWLREGTESLTPAEYPWDNDYNRTWLQCRGLIQDYTAVESGT